MFETSGFFFLILLLTAYTDLANSTLNQRLSVFYSGSVELLVYFLQQIAGDVRQLAVNEATKSGGLNDKVVGHVLYKTRA
jgi:hypothetical protein